MTIKKLTAVLFLFIFFSLCQIIAQDIITVEVSFDKKTVLLFDDNIIWSQMGSKDQVTLAEAEDFRYILQTNEDYGSSFFPTNLLVNTADGYYYNFEIKYNNHTKNTLVVISSTQASFKKGGRLKEVEAEVKTKEEIVISNIIKNSRTVFGLENNGMKFLFQGTYNTDNEIYFHVRVENESDIAFDVDLISFFLVKKGSGKGKKSTHFKEPYLNGRIYNEKITTVERKTIVDYVCIFSKFTIDKDKKFIIEIHELEGDRDGILELEASDISSSKYVRI